VWFISAAKLQYATILYQKAQPVKSWIVIFYDFAGNWTTTRGDYEVHL
jgi:hypothetical protein